MYLKNVNQTRSDVFEKVAIADYFTWRRDCARRSRVSTFIANFDEAVQH